MPFLSVSNTYLLKVGRCLFLLRFYSIIYSKRLRQCGCKTWCHLQLYQHDAINWLTQRQKQNVYHCNHHCLLLFLFIYLKTFQHHRTCPIIELHHICFALTIVGTKYTPINIEQLTITYLHSAKLLLYK